jgi:uncharacterized membrane protein
MRLIIYILIIMYHEKIALLYHKANNMLFIVSFYFWLIIRNNRNLRLISMNGFSLNKKTNFLK